MSMDDMLELSSQLHEILRAHGVDASLAAHDASKRLYRAGFRLSAQPVLEPCRGNARCGPGCGQLCVLSQGVCIDCLAKANEKCVCNSEGQCEFHAFGEGSKQISEWRSRLNFLHWPSKL
jgi:hypothetical protein